MLFVKDHGLWTRRLRARLEELWTTVADTEETCADIRREANGEDDEEEEAEEEVHKNSALHGCILALAFTVLVLAFTVLATHFYCYGLAQK